MVGKRKTVGYTKIRITVSKSMVIQLQRTHDSFRHDERRCLAGIELFFGILISVSAMLAGIHTRTSSTFRLVLFSL